MLERKHVTYLLRLASKAYPAAFLTIDSDTVDAWHVALCDLAPHEAVQAVVRSIREDDRVPTPASIRRRLRPSQDEMGDADEAYADLGRIVQGLGWCREVKARESAGPDLWAVMLAVAGSWQAWCSTETDQIPSRRARFVEFWNARRGRAQRIKADQLAGETIAALGFGSILPAIPETADPMEDQP